MKRILIVDDKDDNVYFLRALLTASGYRVDSARDGKAALMRARSQLPDLVITDLLMPNMDGYALLSAWKSDPAFRKVPIIVYTATYVSSEDERLALDLGADDFVLKPAEPKVLLDLVERVMARTELNEPVVEAFDESPSLLARYNATLVRKLEGKMAELEAANHALRKERAQSETLLRLRTAILDSLPANIALIDRDGTIIAVNESWNRVGEANGDGTPAPSVGMNYIDVCQKAFKTGDMSVSPVISGLRSVLSGKVQAFNTDYPCETPHGVVWYRMLVTPIADAERGGAVVVHIDVTEEKRSEEQRRRDAARLALAVASAGIGVWEWEPGKETYFWNDRQYDIFGVPHHEPVTYDSWAAMMPPEERETPEVEFAAVKALGGRRERSYRVVRRDGSERFIQEVEQTLTTTETGAEVLLGTNLDITEQRVRENEIRTLTQRLGLLVSQAPIGILVHNNFRPALVNDELCRLFGYRDHAELLAVSDFLMLFDDPDRALLREQVQALEFGESIKGFVRLRARRKDSALLELEARSFLVDWGDTPSICMMLTDVTEQRKLEAQLRQSQRLEAVGQMTGGVAHDFNNLLTVVLGNADLLSSALQDNSKLQPLVGMIIQASERGAHLSNQLLSFASNRVLSPETVNVNQLVRNLEGLLKRALGEGVDLQMNLAEGVLPALVDAPELENALLNLAVNARDAMPAGGTLRIETANVEVDGVKLSDHSDIPAGRYVLIGVSDTGAGMDERTRQQAFDPFFTTKDVGKGSGLGLSMVYGFVKQSKGHVRLYSEVGQGTTVKVYLPPAKGPWTRSLSLTEHRAKHVGAGRILVVEDDDLVRKQVVAQLMALGYEVEAVPDGHEALKKLKESSRFDLLFTDLIMPNGISGQQLAERANKICPGLEVLFTTGYTPDTSLIAQSQKQGRGLLMKPYRSKDLVEKVRAALEASRA